MPTGFTEAAETATIFDVAKARIEDVLRAYMERMRRQMGTRALSRATSIPPSDVSKMARGVEGRRVTVDNLEKISERLNIPASEMLNDLYKLALRLEGEEVTVHVGSQAVADPELADEMGSRPSASAPEPADESPAARPPRRRGPAPRVGVRVRRTEPRLVR